MRPKYKSEFDFLSFYKKTLNDPLRWIGVLKIVVLTLLAGLMFFFQSCKKLVQIDPPANGITTPQVFSSDVNATSGVNGIYYSMINALSDPGISRGGVTIYGGLSSDELKLFNTTSADRTQFQQNTLAPTNNIIYSSFWRTGYSYIYSANAVIEGLNNSSSVSDSVKAELLAEAKFIRAFENFYLVNLYGDIPLVTSINWRNTSVLSRSSITDVYNAIKADLKDAQLHLAQDYSVGYGERIIPNSFAATALLARVNLYTKDWAGAEAEATKVIDNSNLYSLSSSLSSFYSPTSQEAIWQLKQDSSAFYFYSTFEGSTLIPRTSTSSPFVYLTDSLLKSFEPKDKRRSVWVDSTKFGGKFYYYPKKYRVGPNQQGIAPYSEYYTVLRLAEQYLIRAEARAQQGNLGGAITDLNMIRSRAGLPALSNSLQQNQVIAAIEQENRIEFFAEWGHRWLDLKRWNKADAVLSPIKGTNWQTTDQLYPIPQQELRVDPNLTQNAGY